VAHRQEGRTWPRVRVPRCLEGGGGQRRRRRYRHGRRRSAEAAWEEAPAAHRWEGRTWRGNLIEEEMGVAPLFHRIGGGK
jgi:hypothetical protein